MREIPSECSDTHALDALELAGSDDTHSVPLDGAFVPEQRVEVSAQSDAPGAILVLSVHGVAAEQLDRLWNIASIRKSTVAAETDAGKAAAPRRCPSPDRCP